MKTNGTPDYDLHSFRENDSQEDLIQSSEFRMDALPSIEECQENLDDDNEEMVSSIDQRTYDISESQQVPQQR